MTGLFRRIRYDDLTRRQQKQFDVCKIAARLVDVGFTSITQPDVDHADFVALHIDERTQLRVKLERRMLLDRRYLGQEICIAFRLDDQTFVYPHDRMVERVLGVGRIAGTLSWDVEGLYHWPYPPVWAMEILADYEI